MVVYYIVIWYCRFVQSRPSRNGATQLVPLPGKGFYFKKGGDKLVLG